jgi:outer membrane biosynthesis protein TonB
LAATLTAGVSPAGSFAQEFKAGGKRKVVFQVRPAYPPLARKLNIIGTVRLLATVAPAGNVLRTEELGGSPLLVRAAVEAVAKTKWEAGKEETKEIVEIRFQPETE